MHVLYAETEFILNSYYIGRVKETQVKGKKKKKRWVRHILYIQKEIAKYERCVEINLACRVYLIKRRKKLT